MTNPFNVLRVYAKQPTKEAIKADQIIESFKKALEGLSKGASQSIERNKNADESTSSESEEKEEIDKLSKDLIRRSSKRLGLAGLIKLIKWVDDMIIRAPKEVIEDIAKYMRDLGVIDEEE